MKAFKTSLWLSKALACLLFLSVPLHAQEVLSDGIQSTIQVAIKTHPNVLAAEADVKSAETVVEGGAFRWLPSLGVSSRMGESGDRYSTLGLSQVLFDFGKIESEYDVNKARESVAEMGRGVSVETIGLQAAMAYLNLARAKEQLEAAQRNVDEHKKLHASVSNRGEKGIGSKSDITLATSRLQQAVATERRWQGEVRRAEANYLSVVGQEAANIRSDAVSDLEVQGGKDGLLDRVLARSPSLKKLKEEVKLANADVEVKKADLWPTLLAKVDKIRQHGSSYPGSYDNDTRFSVNFEWQTDVALRKRYQVQASQQLVQSAEQKMDAEQRRLIETATSFWVDYITARSRSKELDAFAVAAAETAKLFKRQFSIGRRSWPEVMNTLQDLYAADTQKVDVRYEVMMSRVRLAFVGGELDTLLGLANKEGQVAP